MNPLDLGAFRAMMGKYNLGGLVLSKGKDGTPALDKRDNHASFLGHVFLDGNDLTGGNAADNAKVRRAFYNALKTDAESRYGANADGVREFLDLAYEKLISGKTRVRLSSGRIGIMSNSVLGLSRSDDVARLLDEYDSRRLDWQPSAFADRVVEPAVDLDATIDLGQSDVRNRLQDEVEALIDHVPAKGAPVFKRISTLITNLNQGLVAGLDMSRQEVETIVRTRPKTLKAYVADDLARLENQEDGIPANMVMTTLLARAILRLKMEADGQEWVRTEAAEDQGVVREEPEEVQVQPQPGGEPLAPAARQGVQRPEFQPAGQPVGQQAAPGEVVAQPVAEAAPAEEEIALEGRGAADIANDVRQHVIQKAFAHTNSDGTNRIGLDDSLMPTVREALESYAPNDPGNDAWGRIQAKVAGIVQEMNAKIAENPGNDENRRAALETAKVAIQRLVGDTVTALTSIQADGGPVRDAIAARLQRDMPPWKAAFLQGLRTENSAKFTVDGDIVKFRTVLGIDPEHDQLGHDQLKVCLTILNVGRGLEDMGHLGTPKKKAAAAQILVAIGEMAKGGLLTPEIDEGAWHFVSVLLQGAEGNGIGITGPRELLDAMRTEGFGFDALNDNNRNLDVLKELVRQNGGSTVGLADFTQRTYGRSVSELIGDANAANLLDEFASGRRSDPITRFSKATRELYDLLAGKRDFSAAVKSRPEGKAAVVGLILALGAQDFGQVPHRFAFGRTAATLSVENGRLVAAFGETRIKMPLSATQLRTVLLGDVLMHAADFGPENLSPLLPADGSSEVRSPASRELYERLVLVKAPDLDPLELARVPTDELRTLAVHIANNPSDNSDPMIRLAVEQHQPRGLANDRKIMSEGAQTVMAQWRGAGVDERSKIVYNQPEPTPKQRLCDFVSKLLLGRDRLAASGAELPEGAYLADTLAEYSDVLANLIADVSYIDQIGIDDMMRALTGGAGAPNVDGASITRQIKDLVARIRNENPAIRSLYSVSRGAKQVAGKFLAFFGADLEELDKKDEKPDDGKVPDDFKLPVNLVRTALDKLLVEVRAVLHPAEGNPPTAAEIDQRLAAADEGQRAALEEAKLVLDMGASIREAVNGGIESAQDGLRALLRQSFNLDENGEPVNAAAEDSPTWSKSLNELMAGVLIDPNVGYGRFLVKSLWDYFGGMNETDRRLTLSGIVAELGSADTDDKRIAALFRSMGPLMQKILQGLPADRLPPQFAAALEVVKSDLAPIPAEYVRAQLYELVRQSGGQIASITVKASLGAASVGEVFLCRVAYADGSPEREVVVKVMRPDIQARAQREAAFFIGVSEGIPGMQRTYEGQLRRYKEEFDFTLEARNVQRGKAYHQTVFADVRSMNLDPTARPTAGVLTLEKAPGMTLDKYVRRQKADLKKLIESGTTLRPDMTRAAKSVEDYTQLRRELTQRLDEVQRRQNHVEHLVETWIEEAFFKGGFYHGDLHAGNIMSDPSGVTVIDYGNATQLSNDERMAIMKLAGYAMTASEGSFLDAFETLVSPQSREILANRDTRREILNDLTEVFAKGEGDGQVAERIFGAIARIQRKGVEIPPSLYNFLQCLVRLNEALESLSKLEYQLQEAFDSLRLPELAPGNGFGPVSGLDAHLARIDAIRNSDASEEEQDRLIGELHESFNQRCIPRQSAADADGDERPEIEQTAKGMLLAPAPDPARLEAELFAPFERMVKAVKPNIPSLSSITMGMSALSHLRKEAPGSARWREFAGTFASHFATLCSKTSEVAAEAARMRVEVDPWQLANAVGRRVTLAKLFQQMPLGASCFVGAKFKLVKEDKYKALVQRRKDAARAAEAYAKRTGGPAADVRVALRSVFQDFKDFNFPFALREKMKTTNWMLDAEVMRLVKESFKTNLARFESALPEGVRFGDGSETGSQCLGYVLSYLMTQEPVFGEAFSRLTPLDWQVLAQKYRDEPLMKAVLDELMTL